MSLGIDGLEQETIVARGAFGVVYRAWQPSLHRHVAVKVIVGAFDEAALRRFERECATVGSLSQVPGILPVYAVGRTAEGSPYLVMPFVDGGSLADRVAAGPMPPADVVSYGIRIGRALAAAHERGVLHLDVKPANVLTGEGGHAQLVDFGISRFVDDERGGHTATIAGTPGYADPAIFAGHQPVAASDVYGLGATMHALAGGRAPFSASDAGGLKSLLGRITGDPPPDLRSCAVPDELCRVIERAMMKEPADRYRTMTEMVEALEAVARELDVSNVDGRSSGVTEHHEQASGDVTRRERELEVCSDTLWETVVPQSEAAPPALPASQRRGRLTVRRLDGVVAGRKRRAVVGVAVAIAALTVGARTLWPAFSPRDVWAASVLPDKGGVAKIDRSSGEVLARVPINHLTEEPVVTERLVWVVSNDPEEGAVVTQIKRDDAIELRRIPLGGSNWSSIEMLSSGDGVWVVSTDSNEKSDAIRIDNQGEIVARAHLEGVLVWAEPLADDSDLFVPLVDGAIRVDADGTTSDRAIVPGGRGRGGIAFSDGRLFVVRNEAVHEFDPVTLRAMPPRFYTEDGERVQLLSSPSEAGPFIEEVYASETLLSFLTSDDTTEGTYFVRVDANTGEVLLRIRLPGEQAAGRFDLRQSDPETFWGYLSVGSPALLKMSGDGEIDRIELPPRTELDIDPDLVMNGRRLVITDADAQGNPVVYVIDPETGHVAVAWE